MARINIANLIAKATDVTVRLDSVRQDPAVVKAAKEAAADVLQAGYSIAKMSAEVRLAWCRAADRGRSATSATRA